MKNESAYTQFALVREMLQTSHIIENFQPGDVKTPLERIREKKSVFFTGEGSSRIFPAKNAMTCARRAGLDLNLATDGATQAQEYKLNDFVVFGASNSGQTKEVVSLFQSLKNADHQNLFGVTANIKTKLEDFARWTRVLDCGKEDAVAATKSVVEQALFYQYLLAEYKGQPITPKLKDLAHAVAQAMTTQIDPAITHAVAQAGTIYFAGRNDGAAEELTLKTNEITRKKSDFLEGTYLLHGVEEVMNTDDVVILVDPFPGEYATIQKLIVQGVGLNVFAIAPKETPFPTIRIHAVDSLNSYVALAAGWNLLVEVGLALEINLDKAERARKIGNAFEG